MGKVEELVIVLIILLVLFGGKKLPQLARGIGESVKEVRKGFNGDTTDSAADPKDKPSSEKKNS